MPRLLAAKFHIPIQRSSLVGRPRLLNILQRGLEENRKLTLVSAPAGYGKTTIVAEWAAGLRSGVAKTQTTTAWLSLDEADNEPTRFLRYFMTAFQQENRMLGIQARSLLEMPNLPPLPHLFDDLLNDLAALDTPFVLILDDYHVIIHPAIRDVLEYFLDHQPAAIHLVLITRADPALPLARLRARRQMTEIRARDLRFTIDEARAFLGVANLPLAETALRALDERTEGWVAGLQLATLALQYQPDPANFIETFRGSHRYVLDYLAEEVLRQQGEVVRGFLTQTSILERFDAALCDFLTGRQDSRLIIAQLEQKNLFIIPLDDERRWYRYHHLFADYLRSLLTRAEQTALFKHASTWFQANKQASEAVRNALASSDMEFAADVIEWALQESTTWAAFDLGLYTSWLKALPDQALHTRPHLCLDAAHIFYAAGQLDRSEAYISQAERSFGSLPDQEQISALAGLYHGLITAVRGEFQQAITQITTAREHIPAENRLAHSSAFFSLGQAYYWMGENDRAIECYLRSSDEARAGEMLFPMVNSRCAAARLQVTQGRLRLAEQTSQQAIQYAENPQAPQLGLAWSLLGGIALERNNLADAERFLQTGLTLSRRAQLNDDITWGLIYLARLRVAQSNPQGAITTIQEAQNIVQAYGIPRLSHVIAAYVAHIQLITGRDQQALDWAREYKPIRGKNPVDHAELTLARVLLHFNKLDDVHDILNALLENAAQMGRGRTCIEAMTLYSWLNRAKGEAKNAVAWLEKALQRAAPENFVRLFLDEGAQLLELLPQARQSAPEFVDSIINAISTSPRLRPAPIEELPNPLSNQEIRVLKLIVNGKSNAEIAADLVISVGTAKWHVHNVLQKLGVGNRPQAIARARELGI